MGRDRTRLRHQLDVTFGEDVRGTLDALAFEHGLVHGNGIPRDAELVRVLLVARLARDRTARERLACALYSNSVLALSQASAEVLASLRGELGRMAGRIVSAGRVTPVRRRGRPKGEKRSSRNRVCLTLDDWLYWRLERTEREVGETDVQLVRRLLGEAVREAGQHRSVLTGYAEAMRGLQAALRDAVEREGRKLGTILSRIGGRG